MFEWDENKRLKNLEKHKLDFVAAVPLFDGRSTVTATSNSANETRYVTTGFIDGKFYTVIWTWKGSIRRIISFRRARHAEERAYCTLYGI
uniref:BrnT family toxin n=1 Tax=Chlorobium chlorochromatii (strain CaD3) TaxID=340177 RepID=Q3AQV5_CHLCH